MLAYSLHFYLNLHFVLNLNYILATLMLDAVCRYKLLTNTARLLMMMRIDYAHFVDGLRLVF